MKNGKKYAKKNYRIVNINDKIPMYKHILLTEKYNFNNIQWDQYGHNSDGGASPTKEDLTLGLMYPSDDNDTKLGKFVSLVQPYLQTWYIPLGMYSILLSSYSNLSFAYDIISYSPVPDTRVFTSLVIASYTKIPFLFLLYIKCVSSAHMKQGLLHSLNLLLFPCLIIG